VNAAKKDIFSRFYRIRRFSFALRDSLSLLKSKWLFERRPHGKGLAGFQRSETIGDDGRAFVDAADSKASTAHLAWQAHTTREAQPDSN
jgi:hypothetical protein